MFCVLIILLQRAGTCDRDMLRVIIRVIIRVIKVTGTCSREMLRVIRDYSGY